MRCLESFNNQTYPNVCALLVDNNSDDGSPDIIAKHYPNIHQIVNMENLGFARGINIGLKYALDQNAEYIFISNNDAYINNDCLETLLRYHTIDVGILAPMIYYTKPPNRIWSMGGKIHPGNLEVSDKWAEKIDAGDWPDFIEQDFVPGCGMLFPRETLLKVGLFDESFSMYYEDLDYCLRVRKSNLKIKIIPEAKMWHQIASSSGGSDTPNERYWMARSSVRYFAKHAIGVQIPYIFFWRTGSTLRTSFRLIRKHRWQSAKAYWRGLKDGLSECFGGKG